MVPRHTQWDGIYETFHGGMLGTIADTVTCWSILTEIGADSLVATTDFNIRFLRPCHTDVVCKAHVVRVGRTMCLAHADLYQWKIGRSQSSELYSAARLGSAEIILLRVH